MNSHPTETKVGKNVVLTSHRAVEFSYENRWCVFVHRRRRRCRRMGILKVFLATPTVTHRRLDVVVAYRKIEYCGTFYLDEAIAPPPRDFIARRVT